MHALGEEREGRGRERGARGGEWRGGVGEAKEKGKKREKRLFYWGVIKHVCHFTWIYYSNVILLFGETACETPSFCINLLFLKVDFLGHSFIHYLGSTCYGLVA